MTEPRDTQRGLQAKAAADLEPEEIQDLDVTGDDADRVAAGGEKAPYLKITLNQATISSV
jgi:hypothetical protein